MKATIRTIEFDPANGFGYSHLSEKLKNRIRYQMGFVRRLRKERAPFRIRILEDGRHIVERSKKKPTEIGRFYLNGSKKEDIS